MSAPVLLVADPDPAFCEQARTNLETEGYVVVVATDGRDALAQAQTQAVDLIVVDVRLPRLDGWKLVKRVRALEGQAQLPVLFLADRSTDTTRRQAMKVGIDDVLLKPVHPETLAFRVARALSRRYKVERTQRTLQRASDTRRLMLASQPTVVRSKPARAVADPARPAPAKVETAALSGDLEHCTLPTVLGMLEVEHKTGRLTVVNGEDGAMGWMELRSGRVVRGRADALATGESAGRRAILDMLAWPTGAFRFFVEPVESVDEIGAPITELLIEGARFADESARLGAIATPAPLAPPPSAPGPELPRRVPRDRGGAEPDPADDLAEPASRPAIPVKPPAEPPVEPPVEPPGEPAVEPISVDDTPAVAAQDPARPQRAVGDTDDPGPEFK